MYVWHTPDTYKQARPVHRLLKRQVTYWLEWSVRVQVRHLGGCGGMLPPGNFGFLDLLRWFLMQFWSNKVPANANCTWLAKTVIISGMRPDSSCIQGWWEMAASTACCAVESVFISTVFSSAFSLARASKFIDGWSVDRNGAIYNAKSCVLWDL